MTHPIAYLMPLIVFAVSFIPALGYGMPIIYATIFITLNFIMFVPTGDMRASYLLPVKRTDYIRSKLIITATAQCITILLMFAVCLITYQFELMPYFINGKLELTFFASLFVMHALSNLVLFALVFKHPRKKRTYALYGLTYFVLLLIACGLSTISIANFVYEILIVFGGFVFYIIIMLLAWVVAKNKKADVV